MDISVAVEWVAEGVEHGNGSAAKLLRLVTSCIDV
jgi:hypothetical protein